MAAASPLPAVALEPPPLPDVPPLQDSSPMPLPEPFSLRDFVITSIKERLAMTHLCPSMWNPALHYPQILPFFTQHSCPLLLAYIEPPPPSPPTAAANGKGRLVFCTNQQPPPPLPPHRHGHELAYFIRPGPRLLYPQEADEFDARVQYGLLHADYLGSLARLMEDVFSPLLAAEQQWPESVRDEFAAGLNRFMSALTDARHRASGKTVLYVPTERLDRDVSVLVQDRELLQRLEATVIHWTRQIKEVLTGASSPDEAAGLAEPLDELAFWQQRCDDMNGISSQLDKRGVTRILELLTLAKSSYMAPFNSWATQIQDGRAVAESNLKFLSVLKEPCGQLQTAAPNAIPDKLPRIIDLIRMIWLHSPHYNSRERITGLFQKLSNVVLHRCTQAISLDDVFEGDVDDASRLLRDSIGCCEAWEAAYAARKEAHETFSDQPWLVSYSAIFAQNAAFIQRCRDLLEVCESQAHFARRRGTASQPLPMFAGTRGLELARSLSGIEHAYHQALQQLRQWQRHLLDVKSSDHQPAFNSFRAALKDLDVMLQNTVSTAFATATTVEAGVELLAIFSPLRAREPVRRMLDKVTQQVFKLFAEQLEQVKKSFNNLRHAPPLEPGLPRYAGAAFWALRLKAEIDAPQQLLRLQAQAVEAGSYGNDILHQHSVLSTALNDFVVKTHAQWIADTATDLSAQLGNSLMRRSPNRALLMLSFDHTLLRLFREHKYWERLGVDIPHPVQDMAHKGEELRALRGFIMLVVCDYNAIIECLSAEERQLFRERIRYLDTKIQPGLAQLSWASKGIKDYYVAECRLQAKKLRDIVDRYVESNERIQQLLQAVTSRTMITVDPKRLYSLVDFQQQQEEQIKAVRARFAKIHAEIQRIMSATHEVFKRDGPEVDQYWARYCRGVDRQLEEALRLNVKRSLQDLLKAVAGDGKSIPSPVFGLSLGLDSNKLSLQPAYSHLASVLRAVGQATTEAVRGMERLPVLLCNTGGGGVAIAATSSSSSSSEVAGTVATTIASASASASSFPTSSYEEVIFRDRDIVKLQQQLQKGLEDNEPHIEAYKATWHEKFHELWETEKDRFMARYAQLSPALSKFDGDVARYGEVSNNVQKEETFTAINSVQLDNTLLKLRLLEHCEEWQLKLTQLLHRKAKADLAELRDYMRRQTQQLVVAPVALDQVVASVQQLQAAKNYAPTLESRFGPLQEEFAILAKYGVELEEQTTEHFAHLQLDFQRFQQALQQGEQLVSQAKQQCKTELMQSMDELTRSVVQLRSQFLEHGPFSSSIAPEAALQLLAGFKERVTGVRQTAETLKAGLRVFELGQEPFKEVIDTIREVGQLEQIWQAARAWQEQYGVWQGTQFGQIVTAQLEQQAAHHGKKLTQLARDCKDKQWEVVRSYKARMEQFKRAMPLIQGLKNPALRPRHWRELEGHAGKLLEPGSPSFTLGFIIEAGLDRFTAEVAEISAAASKELAIEQSLAEIRRVWSETALDIVPHRDRGHFVLKSTEELFQLLEDNQVSLSTMKASRYAKAFEQEVDEWERALSLVLEVVEMVLAVQRQWMYLENIFMGEDIRKQLPVESSQFDDVDSRFVSISRTLHADNNAKRATHQPHVLLLLTEMSSMLEQIQKSLDSYLETKRQYFPRFYFVSDDDLLEMLGQSKNPEAIQAHLLKCFDSIKSLELHMPAGRKVVQAIGMHSSDAEYVPFKAPVPLEGAVEVWLLAVEKEMRCSLRLLLAECMTAHRQHKRERWLREWAGQLVLMVSQLDWTSECVKAMADKKTEAKNGLRALKKKQATLLNKLTEAVRSVKNKTQRKKLVNLITLEVHARDVVERLAKVPDIDHNSFDWLMQLRFYWEKQLSGDGECVIRQTNTRFTPGYEYMGNAARLVITPLTDRCYMTLTTALHLKRGGSPKGPAGTGKTETVKDLSKAMARLTLVLNCSPSLDYMAMGRFFSGLAQTGAWGCFDEFNRINIEVLSVVAQQILAILQAQVPLSPDNPSSRFIFEGSEIALKWSCGIFITMNPGYAGRSELPDNLKSMFRPISMMKPDTALIAEILLFSQGFSDTRVLATKADTLYRLAEQQLSKQDHYDFGLRALVSTLMYAGRKRQELPDKPHEEVLLLAMRDMNVAKMTGADLPLLLSILGDLFPGLEAPEPNHGAFRAAIETELQAQQLQVTAWTVAKILQLYETKLSRHAVMIVGRAGSGKSVAWRTLQRAMSRCQKDALEGFEAVRDFPINPKALSLSELYGEFNLASTEWKDGVLSAVVRGVCADDKPDQKWLVLDGPVDTLWIESMNSVMDDNKILTLINGERISIPPQVSLLFEVEDLAMASPATVSRCGMVYHDASDLGWQPFVASWLARLPEASLRGALQRLMDKYVARLLEFVRSRCSELVATTPLNRVQSLCRLLEALLTPAHGVDASSLKPQSDEKLLEPWFLFACVWSLCASVNEEGRRLVDNYLRELEGGFPSRDTVYEYVVDPASQGWAHWEQQLRAGWRYPSHTAFHKLLVPTVDTVRYRFLLDMLVQRGLPTLMVGPVGTGKTSVVEMVMQGLDSAAFNLLSVNMSSKTSSNNLQAMIEAQVEKRTKGIYVPLNGRQLLAFLDDLNMPLKDSFDSQPPLELLRQWLEYGFVYDRQKQLAKQIKGMRLVAAMGPPGGGRSVISSRLQRHFNLINMTFPTDTQLKRIFGSLISQKLQDFHEECKAVGDMVTKATLDIFQFMSSKMLPTPTKIHYLFNLRDISKVFQGLLRAHRDFHDTKESLTRLWVHECFRVFGDRLTTSRDEADFVKVVEDKLHEVFDVSLSTLCPNRELPIFADFLRGSSSASTTASATHTMSTTTTSTSTSTSTSTPTASSQQETVYEDVKSLSTLRKVLQDKLEEYNSVGHVPMDLVLFKDAIQHVCRIARVVRVPRGNMLLIGVGGSGRQSLARLAAFVLGFQVFRVEITRHYRSAEFRQDLRQLYRLAGVENKPSVFLFTDTQIVDESFLEDMNNILSSGEVAALFELEELEQVRGLMAPVARQLGWEETPQQLDKLLVERVRCNLHVVLCMSPVGETFRSRLRMYPALVNCTTIDYFSAWPQDALLAVAQRYMGDVVFGSQDGLTAVAASKSAGGEQEQEREQGPERERTLLTPDAASLSGHGGHTPSGRNSGGELQKRGLPPPASAATIKREAQEAAEVIRTAVSSTFAVIQQSVIQASERMRETLRRPNYVTPTNYLELVSGYKALLAEKRKALGEAADKLVNGLGKIDETRAKVETMSVELEQTKRQVQEFQRECDEYLVVIVQQKREADEQQKAVSARSEKIAVEAKECEKMATDARADLDEALPALEAAMEALHALNKNDITEIKSYSKPPEVVEMVMQAVMVLRKSKPDWAEAKRQLGETNFIRQLVEFDKNNMSEKVLKKIHVYVNRAEFQPDVVGRVSNAARSLCMWVRAMDVYGRVYKVVEPKRNALKRAQETLAAKQQSLAEAAAKLKEVTDRVEQLQKDYEQKLATKEELRLKSELTAVRLERAAKLVSGLAGERSRWEQNVKELRTSMGFVVGDCLLAAGFLSYLGPFPTEYRDEIVQLWLQHVSRCGIPVSPTFDMATFLARPTDVRFWNIQGLPSDRFSTENGVLVTRGQRWPLMIDPQGQALKWVKNMEGERGLKVIDLQQADYMRTLENAMQFGTPVLLQNVGEELDPALGPILNRAFTKVGGRLLLKIGDKEVEFNPEFRFYLTTKLSNPHYTPEISTKTTIVNFAVVEQGLQAQLLGIVVSRERPELEQQKNELVMTIAGGKKKLVELEDKILQLLSLAKGSLLDDEELVTTLNSSKVTSVEVGEALLVAEQTEREIDVAREGYRASAQRASILFFVLNDVAKIDPMYQFALDAYINLFHLSISSSAKVVGLEARIDSINEYHTYAVYRYACRALFERHKLLFAVHMNAKILEATGKLSLSEYSFFLRGGQVLDRAIQVPNPAPGWISAEAWDNLTEMERTLGKFSGLCSGIEQQLRDWQNWYIHPQPESAALPGEWENACSELQRMVVVRALRPDRVGLVAHNFVVNNLGQKFVEPPGLDMKTVLADSTAKTPLVFVLSVGVDPAKMLTDLAEKSGMGSRFYALSLGQGQASVAERLLADGMRGGHWVYLANCHLSLSWMPTLSKIVEQLETAKVHPDFRLWLSSKPEKEFPISILQVAIKMTTEPPSGIRANMRRLYSGLSEERFERCRASEKYKKLMFALSFFHSILLERKKFQMLGWNVLYPFNDSDFEVSENLLALFLDEYPETPWEALKYLVAGINYGGHVTDDWDRRLLMTYIHELFCEEVLRVEHKRVSGAEAYYVPTDGSLQTYREYVAALPSADPPAAFGQNTNADISAMIRQTKTLLGTLVGMQPAVAAAGAVSGEEKVLELARDMQERLPNVIDYEATAKLLAVEPNPLNVVLLQEIQRYNGLLVMMRGSLQALVKGIQGLVVMSSELEEIFSCIHAGKVPPAWGRLYPSQKPLASWIRDLVERVDFFEEWAVTGRPPLIFWLSAFTFPTGFLTAVLQKAARGNGISIDSLSWEFPVMTLDDVHLVEPPKDGVYVRGLYLEGASWDRKRACLEEPSPMQLVCNMPTIHFKPVENKKAVKKGMYACPCYYYPNRAGEGGGNAWSFVLAVELKSGDLPSEHWIKRGTALLMSLES